MSVVSAVFCQVESLRWANHSTGGVLPNLVCLNVVSKPEDEDT